ncbi:GPI inositol deacylase [Hypoxylon texense]
MGIQQPYLYDSDSRDSRLPEKPFDPKAVTRASWEPKPRRPKKQDGPLVSLNRHPDAHEVPTGRTSVVRPMSSSTKSWIKFMRYFQLFFRVFEMITGAGLLTLMILIGNVDPLTAWVLRITPGVVAISCVYAIWHFIRPANARPPASSAAYQAFAGVMDLAVIPLYSFGVIATRNHGGEWNLIVASTPQFAEALVLSEYYALICGAGMHAVSLGVSIWLGLMFHRIASMPPDMNPLEDHLTSRAKYHKRNKSSVATSYTAVSEYSKRLSTPLEDYRSSGAPYETLSRPPSIPFMHTRSGSRDSFASSKRDSRTDLPSRQYQVTPGNSPRNSPRNSVAGSLADLQRLSTPRLAQRGSYTEVPLHETGVAPASPSSSRPSSVTIAPSPHQPINASPTRVAKFTEAWYASESLINRTQERKRAQDAAERRKSQLSQSQSRSQSQLQYEALNPRYDFNDSDDDDSDRENMMRPGFSDSEDDHDEDGNVQSSPINVSGQMHPNPLRLHPVPAAQQPQITTPSPLSTPRQKTPFRSSAARESVGALSEISLNPRSVSGSQDIADEAKTAAAPATTSFWRRSTIGKSRRAGAGGGVRNSSIQADSDFYAKPYGELKPATPPIMGITSTSTSAAGARQVSSGNDYADLGSGTAWRRNVSGKIAEEGLAGRGYSRYSILNDD